MDKEIEGDRGRGKEKEEAEAMDICGRNTGVILENCSMYSRRRMLFTV